MIHDVAHGLAAAVQGGGEPSARLDAGIADYTQVVGHLLQDVEAQRSLLRARRRGSMGFLAGSGSTLRSRPVYGPFRAAVVGPPLTAGCRRPLILFG